MLQILTEGKTNTVSGGIFVVNVTSRHDTDKTELGSTEIKRTETTEMGTETGTERNEITNCACVSGWS